MALHSSSYLQFPFRCVDKDEIIKNILNLDASKARQDSDIPSRIIKKNAADFHRYSSYQFEYPSILKLANITHVFKRGARSSMEISFNQQDQSAYFQISQQALNDKCFVKFPVLWIPIYHNNNVDLEKATTHGIAC